MDQVLARMEACAAGGAQADAEFRNELDAAAGGMMLCANQRDATLASMRGETPCAGFWKTVYANGPRELGGPEVYLAVAGGSALERYDGTPVDVFPTCSFGVKPVGGTGTFLMGCLSMDMRAKIAERFL